MTSERRGAKVVPLEPKSAEAKEKLPEVAEVDGMRVVIRGYEEIVLECGEATIILKANGKIVIRGVEIESHAMGLNRIKGGGVKVN